MLNKRIYPCKDVELLMTSRIIAESFKSYQPELASIRLNWTEDYAAGLLSRIEHAIGNYLGVDAKKALRDASLALNNIQVPARRDVAFFKTQVEVDFRPDKTRRDEILAMLGYDKTWKKVLDRSQESLIELLYTFKKNFNEALKAELAGKSINPALPDRICGYADLMHAANAVQEEQKAVTKGITGETIGQLNAIYDEIMSVCRIAAAYYRYDPLKKEQFSFSKVLRNLGAAGRSVKPAVAVSA